MKKILLVILLVSLVEFSFTEGKRRRSYFREVAPTTTDAIIRSQRGVIATGYQNKVVEQHNAATAALEEVRQSTQATQFLTENLQNSIRIRQQLGFQYPQQVAYPEHNFDSSSPPAFFTDYYSSIPSQMTIIPGGIRLVDQYGNEVGQTPAFFQESGYSYPVPSSMVTTPQHPETNSQSTSPGVQNAYLPRQTQPQMLPQVQQQQQIVYPPATQYLPQPGVYSHPQQPQFVQTQPHPHYVTHSHPSLIQPQPAFQQFITPEGLLLPHHHQVVEHAQVPQTMVFYHTYQPQLPAVVDHQDHPAQVYHHHQYPPPQLSVETTTIHKPQPVIEKIVRSTAPPLVVEEEVLPTLKLIKQPILSPADFQKEIFAVKNPSVRVLTFSDLCTVYPYQRKLSACVYKKAAIPELHHPDIQLVPEQTKINPTKMPIISIKPTKQTMIMGYGQGHLNPRTQALRLSAPSSANNNDDEGAGSIQDILGDQRQKTSLLESSSDEEKHDNADAISIAVVENADIAESSNKQEKLVIKTTKPKTPINATRHSNTSKRPKNISTTTVPSTSSTTTRKTKKAKRKSSKRSSRKNRKQQTTTTQQPFKLA